MASVLRELARAPEKPVDEDLRIGERIGRFELLHEIGRGGFGVVYEARDTELGRHVAIKVMRERDGITQELFKREAEMVARLQHPAIVTLFDYGNHRGRPYLVLERLRGETLQARIERAPLALSEALAVMIATSRGLARAHESGVLHRDLKPSNVFLTEDGEVKLLDFGLARMLGAPAAELAAGTPGYTAPEQWRGAPGDARSDVFSVGVMLFVMLTGKRPYAVTTTAAGVVLEPAGASRSGIDGAPEPLAKLVWSAMALDVDERPSSVKALLAGLLEAQRALEGVATRADTSKKRRGPLLAGLGVIAAAGVITAAVLLARPDPPVLVRDTAIAMSTPLPTAPTMVATATSAAPVVSDASIPVAPSSNVDAAADARPPVPVRKASGGKSARPNSFITNNLYDSEQLRKVLAGIQARVNGCYAASEFDKDEHWSMDWQLGLTADGAVTSVAPVGNVRDAKLDACMSPLLRSLSFGATATGKPGSVLVGYSSPNPNWRWEDPAPRNK